MLSESLFDEKLFSSADRATLLKQFRLYEKAMSQEVSLLKQQLATAEFKISKLTNNNDPTENESDAEDDEKNVEIEVPEVCFFDPFCSITALTKYDGNPNNPFSKWVQCFRDALKLVPNLT